MIKKTITNDNKTLVGFSWTVTYDAAIKTTAQNYIEKDHLLGLYRLIQKNRIQLQFKMFTKGNVNKHGLELLKKQIEQLSDIRKAIAS
jgi:hypothetical protein